MQKKEKKRREIIEYNLHIYQERMGGGGGYIKTVFIQN